MSELRHLVNSQSPLFNTLQSFSSNDPFEYEIAKSYPNVVKTRIELNMDSNASMGGQVVVALPKYGMLYKAVVKTRLKIAGGSSGTQLYPVKNLGLHLVERASWMVHNKTIEQQTPQSAEAYMLSLQKNEQDALKRIIRDNLGANSVDNDTFGIEGTAASSLYGEVSWANSNQVDVYTPLFFSFSHSSKQAVDLSFLQSTNLVLQYASAQDIQDTARGTDNAIGNSITSGVTIDSASSKIILYYYQMPNDTMKEIERTLFDATTPLTMLGKSFFAETDSVNLSTVAAKAQEEVTIDLNCKNCVYQSVVCVRAEDTDAAGDFRGGDYLPIKEIELTIGGRSVYKVGGEELNCIDNAWGSGSNPLSNSVLSNTALNHTNNENIYLINHGVIPSSHSQNTGVLSLKNCSSPQIKVTFLGIADRVADQTTYRVMVGHFHYNLITQSGLDGAVQVGISL